MTDTHQTFATFIVRLTRDREGRLHGVVERVSTGAKRPVEDCSAVGDVITSMLNADREERA